MKDYEAERQLERNSVAFSAPKIVGEPKPTVQPIQEQTGACAYDLLNNAKWQEYTDDADGSAGVLAV